MNRPFTTKEIAVKAMEVDCPDCVAKAGQPCVDLEFPVKHLGRYIHARATLEHEARMESAITFASDADLHRLIKAKRNITNAVEALVSTPEGKVLDIGKIVLDTDIGTCTFEFSYNNPTPSLMPEDGE